MSVIYLPERSAPLLRRLILVTGLATTIMVMPPMADPINFPKMFVLLLGATWILGTVLVGMITAKSVKYSLAQWAYFIFGICLFIAALATDVRFTAFYGANQRNNGALSYLAMGLLAFAATMSFKTVDAKTVRYVFLILGGFLTFYGFLQFYKQDPFNWVLVYGPVIGTLGNPDFMSALLGTSAIAVLWFILKSKNRAWQAVAILGLIAELYIVRKTASAQGLLAFAAGAALLIVAKLWQLNRKIGLAAFVLGAVGAIPVLMGIVNKGPFASFIYQSSLKNRLDYWNAALDMFTAHKWLGVGIDRFGEFYPQYAPQVQVVQGQSTNNAHSVFLQLLSTGGLVVMIPYLLILIVLLVTGLRGFFVAKGAAQVDIAAIFAMWFALLLVSVISIDNLGVAVWFWILGGVLYGVSHKQAALQESKPVGGKGGRNAKVSGRRGKKSDTDSSSYFSPVVSICLTILVAAILAPLWGQSSAVYRLQQHYNKIPKESFLAELDVVANQKPVNLQTLITVTDLALRIPEPKVALKYATLIVEADPRNISGNHMLAYAYDVGGNFKEAIKYREMLVEVEPWKTKNMTDLVHDYVVTKQLRKAKDLAAHIEKLSPGSDDAKTAAQLIKDAR
jgi:O-antigen ligase